MKQPENIELRQGTAGQQINIKINSPEGLATSGVTGMSSDFINKTWGPGAMEKFRQAQSCLANNTIGGQELIEIANKVIKWGLRPEHACMPSEYEGKRATDGWPISRGYIKSVIPY